MENWTHVAQNGIFSRIVAIPSSPNRSHHRALGVSRCSNLLTHIQANSRPTAKRVSSTARFTLGDGFGQAYAVKRRAILIRGLEHRRVQLAADNADIAAADKRHSHSVLT